jgi:hypothetical protein
MHDLHVMSISMDGKRETAMYRSVLGVGVWVLKEATRQHGLLSVVEGNGSKFFPVADDGLFHHDFVDSKLPLE